MQRRDPSVRARHGSAVLAILSWAVLTSLSACGLKGALVAPTASARASAPASATTASPAASQ